MTDTTDYDVTVCAECLTASCWHGEFMCQKAKYAGLVIKRASELRAMNREHSDNFNRDKIEEVTGVRP